MSDNNKDKKERPTVLTVTEVAKILRIGKITAYQAIARGEVPYLRFGRRIVIPRHAFELMLNTPNSKIGLISGATPMGGGSL